METLPLFPLGTVLLPGAVLPLQLFEPRYLELAQWLAARPEGERAFGVVLIRSGHEVGPDAVSDVHPVGCEATVEAMGLARGAGGAGSVVHLVATGGRRFRLEGLDEDAGTAYLTARVEWLEEPSTAEADIAEVVVQVRSAHDRYLEVVGARGEPVEDVPGRVAYRYAEQTVLDVADRQRLLEAPDAGARLRLLLELLRRETAIVRRFGALPGTPDLGAAGLS
jgi:Lon protease-like protein